MIIFAPASLQPWYVVWLVPFLVFYPAAAWLIFSCAVSLSYLKYVQPQGTMPLWVLYLEYIPLYALLIAGYLRKTFRSQATVQTVNHSRRGEDFADEV
jgi:hypothetical protein